SVLTGNLAKIAEHGKRADGIVTGMLEHSRGSSGDRRSVDLNGLVEEALNLAYHGGRAQDQSFNGSPQAFQTPPRGGRLALRRFVDGGSRSAYLCPGFRRRASLASPYLSIIFGR